MYENKWGLGSDCEISKGMEEFNFVPLPSLLHDGEG
jgi:hypothetical protein